MNKCKECGNDLTGYCNGESYCWDCHPLRVVVEEVNRQRRNERLKRQANYLFHRRRHKAATEGPKRLRERSQSDTQLALFDL